MAEPQSGTSSLMISDCKDSFRMFFLLRIRSLENHLTSKTISVFRKKRET